LNPTAGSLEPVGAPQLRSTSWGAPVPLRLRTAVAPEEELLVIVNWPVAEPTAVGANWSVRLVLWPGFNVTGSVAPETVKPAPVTDAAFTVTGAEPVDDSVRV